MITHKHLQELVAFKTPSASVLSCFLELEPGDDHASLLSRFQRLSDRTPAAQNLREDVERMAAFIADEFEAGGARALALYSSKKFGLWRAVYLPQPVKTALTAGETPALRPLVAITDQYKRFGVALVGPREARFFEAFLGHGREYPEHLVSASTYPDAAAFTKAVADKLESLSRAQTLQRVVIGVGEDLSRALLGRLHSSLQQNLIVDTELGPEAAVEDVVARIAHCEREARKVRETVLAHRLVDAAKTREAVIGLDRTLDAFQKGKIKTLLVRDGFAKMGRSCPACGELSIAWSKCLTCQTPTVAVFNLVGELAARALERGCEVMRLLHETPLDNLGRIGAELAPTAVKPTISAAVASAAADATAAA